ncbi:MAG: lipocalin family protein, partial [Prosthecobacter sp.]|nr:lipocalin family protein [Prosthecobacter sp.]
DRGFSIHLNLKSGSPPIVHGRDGISQKGSTPGNASHYYSLPRMPTGGTITLGDQTLSVTGDSWMDHEFGTSFLEAGQQGWDWFSAQLDDGSALMLFQLRQATATAPNVSAGTLIKHDGTVMALTGADFHLKPGRTWERYPIDWEIEVPAHRIFMTCHAAMPGQEFKSRATPGLNYWEGAVDYRGTSAGRPIAGHGYLEMTGYGGQPMTRWFGVGH